MKVWSITNTFINPYLCTSDSLTPQPSETCELQTTRDPAASKHTRVVRGAQLRTELQHVRKLAVLMCTLGSD